MYWFVLVALVVVAFQSERFVMVLEAWFTRMPPVNVARPVTERAGGSEVGSREVAADETIAVDRQSLRR